MSVNVNGRRRDTQVKVDWGFLGVLICSATISGLALAQIISLGIVIWKYLTHI